MSTNVLCDLCAREVGHDDSFVVDHPEVVRAFHYECGRLIQEAMAKARGAGRGVRTTGEQWEQREFADRLAAVEDLARKSASVWRLWLGDASKGAINPGTFQAMKALLGISESSG